jgi:hypothetical protein
MYLQRLILCKVAKFSTLHRIITTRTTSKVMTALWANQKNRWRSRASSNILSRRLRLIYEFMSFPKNTSHLSISLQKNVYLYLTSRASYNPSLILHQIKSHFSICVHSSSRTQITIRVVDLSSRTLINSSCSRCIYQLSNKPHNSSNTNRIISNIALSQTMNSI